MLEYTEATSAQILALLGARSGPIGAENYLRILAQAGSAEQLFANPHLALSIPALYGKLKTVDERVRAQHDLKQWTKEGIGAISLTCPQYPALLREIYDPPLIIFYRGVLPTYFPDIVALAVVGSRKADLSGCRIAEEMSAEISRAGNCIVSGLAFGVDASAHRGALSSGVSFPTIAVLGHGLKHFYPAANRNLGDQILSAGGLFLSHFEPEMTPKPIHFLARNRLIAGLSLGVLVIQATAKSGALVTARYGLEEGREVLVIPGNIHDPRYEGSHRLIQQGAHLVCKTNDVYEYVNGLRQEKGTTRSLQDLSPLQQKILEQLHRKGPCRAEEFLRELGHGEGLATVLMELELQGLIERLPGNILSCI